MTYWITCILNTECTHAGNTGNGAVRPSTAQLIITSGMTPSAQQLNPDSLPGDHCNTVLRSTSAANRNGTHLVRRVVDRSSGLSEVCIRSGSYIGVFIASMVYPSPFMDK